MTETAASNRLGALLAPPADAVDRALTEWLTAPDIPETLAAAMRYATLGGGKRLRPALVLLSADAAGGRAPRRADPLPAAVAIEMVHCYSLVHDDLPAMDDDTLRRGRPTTHVRFGQAMAILAGDALLTRAFEVLARGVPEKALASELTAELAAAAGPAGMIAGQVADMGLCPLPAGEDAVRYIHLHKTAALLRAACRMGGLCGGASGGQVEALDRFGRNLGMAFQALDDLLDATAPAETLGKTPGKDAQTGKRTWVDVLGLDRARALAENFTAAARAAAAEMGPAGATLAELAGLLGHRDR